MKPGSMKDMKVLGKNTDGTGAGSDSMKLKDEKDKTMLRKREHKSLMKSLTLAQMSTASMGKFDRKKKGEPDAPGSQKIKKKKSNASLAALDNNRSSEKDRNMKIFSKLQKKDELGAYSGSGSKSNVHLSTNKMVKKAKKGDERRRNLTNL